MPQRLMQNYDSLPTNGILSGLSSLIAFVVSGIDPVYTGIVLPIALWAVGKGIDVAIRVWFERRRRQ